MLRIALTALVHKQKSWSNGMMGEQHVESQFPWMLLRQVHNWSSIVLNGASSQVCMNTIALGHQKASDNIIHGSMDSEL